MYRKKNIFWVFVLICFCRTTAYGALVVRIVDYPAQIPIYSPIFVTAEVKNEGPEDIFLPESSLGFDISDANGHLLPNAPQGDRLHDEIIWLKSGTNYFFQENISRRFDAKGWSPGIYEIYARVQSTGEAVLIDYDVKKVPIRKLRDHEGETSIYSCWRGDEKSDYVNVSVFKSGDPEDEEVLQYVLNQRFPATTLSSQFYRSYDYLVKKYPNNYYTGVAAFTKGAFQQLLELQPTSPLAPYARQKLALARLSEDPKGYSIENNLLKIPETDLPQSLKDYVLQKIRHPVHDHRRSSTE